MTRINVGMLPLQLTDNHLIAEIKEINQLIGSFNVSLRSKLGINNIPAKFTLNSGHVKFFYDKQLFLYNRFNSLKQEALNRGFNIQTEFNDLHKNSKYWNDYTPVQRDRDILIERITSRLKTQKNKIRYCREVIDSELAIELLNY